MGGEGFGMDQEAEEQVKKSWRVRDGVQVYLVAGGRTVSCTKVTGLGEDAIVENRLQIAKVEESTRTRQSQKERMQATSPRRPEQKSEEESMNVKIVVIQESNKEARIRMLEENEDNRKLLKSMSEGSDADMERMLRKYRTAGHEVVGCEQGQHTVEHGEMEIQVGGRSREKPKSNGESRRTGARRRDE